MGIGEVVDGMIKDGLSDVYSDKGSSISRAQQDDYSIQSYERAIAATNAGVFQWEVVPVEVPGARGKPSVIVAKDDGVDKLDAAKVRKLRPAFKEGGTVTAGKASTISGGVAALVLVSGNGARIIVTLLGVLKAKQGTYGVAGVCNGGGGASALVVELTPTFAASHL
ncbi:hypothetical protein R1sor_013548 [Riccia sorocarpa]|uniref:Thiolase N-terminal domain-containing protein n=1 Tax=Riccia sorocarpa TaxID=122646 RepID=A0ABD3H9Q7_9MARC